MKAELVMYDSKGRRRAFVLVKPVTVIGRAEDCDLRIPLASVSRHHCRLVISEDNTITVNDLGSTNGTYVNSTRIDQVQLKAGDRLTVGPVIFTLKLDGLPAETGIRTAVEAETGPADRNGPQFDIAQAISAELDAESPPSDQVKRAQPLADLESWIERDDQEAQR